MSVRVCFQRTTNTSVVVDDAVSPFVYAMLFKINRTPSWRSYKIFFLCMSCYLPSDTPATFSCFMTYSTLAAVMLPIVVEVSPVLPRDLIIEFISCDIISES
jgi:hypothetical protein